MRRRITTSTAAAFAFLAAFALSGLFACPAAHAAPPALDIRPAANDALVQGKWQSLLVTVQNNDAGEALQGEIQVALEDSRRQERLATYTAPVTLPNGAATVRVPVTVFIPQNTLPDVSVFVVNGRGGSGDIVTRRKFDKIPTSSPILTFLAVSSAPDALQYLNGARLGVYAASSGGLRAALPPPVYNKNNPPPRYGGRSSTTTEMPVRVVNRPDPSVLPDRGAGYDAISVIYLGRDVLPDTFSDAQVSALSGWVAGGGLLIAASPKLRADERFREWLPVPTGATGANGEKSAWGRGTIVSPAFDPADTVFAADTNGAARAYWRKTVNSAVSTRSVTALLTTANNYGASGFWSSLFRAPGLQAPGVAGIGIFLGAYLFLLVPLNYVVLRKLDKREWMWATAPVLVVLFSLGAYGFGYATKGTQLFQNVATVSEMQNGSGEAVTCGGVGLFSPRRARYDIQVNLPDAVLWTPNQDYNDYGRSQTNEYGPLVVSEASGTGTGGKGGASARGSEISMWAMRAWGFRTSRVRFGSGLEARLIRSVSNQITGTVANHTGKSLTKVWVSFGDKGQNIGTLRDGETRPVSFGPKTKTPSSKRSTSYNNGSSVQLFDPSQITQPWESYKYGSQTRTKSSTDRTATREAQQEAFRNAAAGGVQGAYYENSNSSSNGAAVVPRTEALVTAFNEDALLPITVDGQTVPSGMNVNILLVHVPLPAASK